jgi:hypothetical protein
MASSLIGVRIKNFFTYEEGILECWEVQITLFFQHSIIPTRLSFGTLGVPLLPRNLFNFNCADGNYSLYPKFLPDIDKKEFFIFKGENILPMLLYRDIIPPFTYNPSRHAFCSSCRFN